MAASQGGYPLGLSASDGNHVGNADTDETGVALAPPHPVSGVRRTVVHITSGLGDSVALRPGQTTTIGFSDNPPTRTMGSALWFFDPNYNSGEGRWSNLEYGVEQGAWGFWDTVKSGQFAGLYIFNTDLSQHPSGDVSSKIAGINFGTNGQIGPAKNILITQRGIGDINYPGPITPGRLFGLSDRGYNYLDRKSKRRLQVLRRGTRYRTAGGVLTQPQVVQPPLLLVLVYNLPKVKLMNLNQNLHHLYQRYPHLLHLLHLLHHQVHYHQVHHHQVHHHQNQNVNRLDSHLQQAP